MSAWRVAAIRRLREAARGSDRHPIMAAAHHALVGAEVAAATMAARRGRVGPLNPGNVTLVVKTFQRPEVARRMLRAVRSVYSGPVIVADDSATPIVVDDPSVRVLALPFDSGVAAGRNALLDAVETEYVWMADDDMIVLPDCDVGRPLAWLDRHRDVDVYGGRVLNLPHLTSTDYLRSSLFVYRGQPRRTQGSLIEGLPVAYKVPNFYVARTEAVRRLRYDDRLKRVDHTDFFTAAYGRLLCVWDVEFVCLHAHAYFDPEYLAFRQDTGPDIAYLGRKWGLGVHEF